MPTPGLSDYFAWQDPPEAADLIFVLAGQRDRKSYGLQLLREGFSPRLILSVGRFEIRQPQALDLQCGSELIDFARSQPVERRHFFLDCNGHSQKITLVPCAGRGTYWELRTFASFLDKDSDTTTKTLMVVSTSIHLRRIRYCCGIIPSLARRNIVFVPVPENLSLFRRDGCWKRPHDWSYVAKEYVKLAAYRFFYRNSRG